MTGKKDEGWAWMTLLSAFVTAFNSLTVSHSFGILNVAFLQRYEQNLATTAIVGSIFLGALFLTGPIASFLINKYGCRITQIAGAIVAFVGLSVGFFVDSLEMFSLTYGLIAGSGLNLCYTVCYVINCFHFKKYLGLAFGITVSAIGLGLLASGPVIQFLIDTYGLHGAFLLMGGMALNNVTFAFLLFPTSAEISMKKERISAKHDKTIKDSCNPCQVFQCNIFKIKSFVIVLAADFLFSLPYAITVFHLPNLSVLSGSSTDEAALLNTALGIGSTTFRLIAGIAIGPEEIDPLLLFLGFNGLLGFLSLTFPLYYWTYTGRFIFCVLYGSYSGGVNGVRNPLYLLLADQQYYSTAIGLMLFAEGIAFVIGPPLGGWIFDITGSYELSFYIAGSCSIASFLLALTSTIWNKVPEKQKLSTKKEPPGIKEQKSMKRRFSV